MISIIIPIRSEKDFKSVKDALTIHPIQPHTVVTWDNLEQLLLRSFDQWVIHSHYSFDCIAILKNNELAAMQMKTIKDTYNTITADELVSYVMAM